MPFVECCMLCAMLGRDYNVYKGRNLLDRLVMPNKLQVSTLASGPAASKMATTMAATRKHVELSLELKRKLIQEHEHGVPFTLLGKKYHIATSTAANIWRKKEFFLRSRMSGSRKRCNDRSKYKIVNQVTALFVKSMLERNHKIDGEVIKRFARTAAAQCNFKDFHGSNGWLDSFKKRENVCWVRRRGERTASAISGLPNSSSGANSSLPGSSSYSNIDSTAVNAFNSLSADININSNTTTNTTTSEPQSTSSNRSDSPNLSAAAAAAALAATSQHQSHQHYHHNHHYQNNSDNNHHQHDDQQQQLQGSPQSPQHHCSSWEEAPSESEHNCAMCNLAAAAASVAALNSADSSHERDHEIEDWFHGIPFLCQYFEDYQSLHHQQVQMCASEHNHPQNGMPEEVQTKPEASLQLTSTEMNSILNDREAPEFYCGCEYNGEGSMVGEEQPRMRSSASAGMPGLGGGFGPAVMSGFGSDGFGQQRLLQAGSEEQSGFDHNQSFGGADELSSLGANPGRLLQSATEYNEMGSQGYGLGGDGGPNSGLLRAESGEFSADNSDAASFDGGYGPSGMGGSSGYPNSSSLDEYSYQNISLVRHYPTAPPEASTSSGNNDPQQQQQQCQQQQQQQQHHHQQLQQQQQQQFSIGSSSSGAENEDQQVWMW